MFSEISLYVAHAIHKLYSLKAS